MANINSKIKNIFSKTAELPQDEPNILTKVSIQSGLQFDQKMKQIANDFIDYITKEMKLKEYPNIQLLALRKKGMTYGSFDPNTNTILVYGKGRGLADILRTAAHELVHFWQKINNKIPKDLKGRDKTIEAEANAVAGELIYNFGIENPDVYELGDHPNIVEKPLN